MMPRKIKRGRAQQRKRRIPKIEHRKQRARHSIVALGATMGDFEAWSIAQDRKAKEPQG